MASPVVRVNLDDKGERIVLKSPWFQNVSEMCQEIPGHNWSKSKRHWTYPLSLQTCRMLRNTFTDMLVIGKELSQWAREAIAQEQAMRALGQMQDAELDRLHKVLPRLAGAMEARTYQRVGAAFISAAPHGGILLADQPGLGKTIQALGGLVERGIEDGLHLVACPATAVRITWEKEVRKWTDFQVFPVYGSAAKKHEIIERALSADGPRFVIINPETARVRLGRWCQKCKMFTEDFTEPQQDVDHREYEHKTSPRPYQVQFPELFDVQWNSITVDESQRFLLGIRSPNDKTMVGEGLCRLQVLPGDEGVKIALSGTPMNGLAEKLWGALHWIDPKKYSSKWHWAKQYFEIEEDRFGKRVLGIAPYREENFYKDLDSIVLRRTKAEVVKDLPPKQYIEHWIDPSPQQQRQYDEMREMGEAMFGKKAVSATGALAELTMLKHIATAYQGADGPVMSKSCKWNALIELLEERGVVGSGRFTDDSKFVIASQFTRVIDAMHTEFVTKLKVPALRITGNVTGNRRLEAQKMFQAAGGPRIMLINTMAGGTAIDLDAHCDELFFMDETFIPDEQEQVEDRIHRVSRIHNVTIHYLHAKGSIDEKIANMNVSKDAIQKKILDGRRSVAFAKRILEE